MRIFRETSRETSRETCKSKMSRKCCRWKMKMWVCMASNLTKWRRMISLLKIFSMMMKKTYSTANSNQIMTILKMNISTIFERLRCKIKRRKVVTSQWIKFLNLKIDCQIDLTGDLKVKFNQKTVHSTVSSTMIYSSKGL